MRVLFWTDGFWPAFGGIETLAVPLVRRLASRGDEVLVLTNQQKPATLDEIDLDGAVVVRHPMWESLARKDLPKIVGLQSAIGKMIRDFSPDLVHLFCLMGSAFFYVKNRRHIDCPVLFSESYEWFRLASLHPVQRDVMASVDGCVACSSPSADAIRRLFPEYHDKLSIVTNGIALTDWQVDYTDPPWQPPTLFCIGRHQLEHKGFDVAVAAMPAILQRFPEARLVIAGDGEGRPVLERMVDSLGLSGLVDVAGTLPAEEKPTRFQRSTMVLMPSRFEPFGLVAAEAGAAFRPCVASRVGGLAEVIEDGRTGLLVPPDDPPALAEAVCCLLAEPARLGPMGRAARERVARLYRFERFVAEYEALYDDLRARAGRESHDRLARESSVSSDVGV